MWELPFPVYPFFLSESHIIFLSKESHVRAIRTATINFDKKTWCYLDNSRGIHVRWQERELTESPKTNGIMRHTAAGYDRESTLSNANVTERQDENNRGTRATEIYCCLPQFIFAQNTEFSAAAVLFHQK